MSKERRRKTEKSQVLQQDFKAFTPWDNDQVVLSEQQLPKSVPITLIKFMRSTFFSSGKMAQAKNIKNQLITLNERYVKNKIKQQSKKVLNPQNSFIRQTKNVGFGHLKYQCNKKQYSNFLRKHNKKGKIEQQTIFVNKKRQSRKFSVLNINKGAQQKQIKLKFKSIQVIDRSYGKRFYTQSSMTKDIRFKIKKKNYLI